MPTWHGKSQGNPLLGIALFILCARHWVLTRLLAAPVCCLLFLPISWTSSGHSYRYFRQRLHYGVIRSVVNVYQNYYAFAVTLLDKVIVMAVLKMNLPIRLMAKNTSDNRKG